MIEKKLEMPKKRAKKLIPFVIEKADNNIYLHNNIVTIGN